jgi:hypothetical protein
MATVSNTITITGHKRPTRSRLRSHRAELARRASIVVGTAAAAAVFLPASLASWAEVDHPELAARIAPWSAPAAASAAASLNADPRSPRVRSLVATALARDLTQVQAIELRALDLVVSGKPAEGRQLFELSDRLSRRSLATRLWLIQDSVDRGSVGGALRNFDIALRTTTDAQPILFPVLAKACADPTLTDRLARLLDRPSDWRLMFFEWVLANDSDVRPVAAVTAHMRDRRFIVSNGIDQRLIERLVTAREFDAALALNQRFGRPAHGVADPHFTDPSARYPFGWGLVDSGSLGAHRAVSGSASALIYSAAPANSGQVAAQLLTLRPGRYALATMTAAGATGAAPYWSISCAEAGGAVIATLDQPMAARGKAETLFSVPDSCHAQWLTLQVRPAPDSSSQSGAVAWVAVAAR